MFFISEKLVDSPYPKKSEALMKSKDYLKFWGALTVFGLTLTASSSILEGFAREMLLAVGCLISMIGTIFPTITEHGFWRQIFVTAFIVSIGMVTLFTKFQSTRAIAETFLILYTFVWILFAITWLLRTLVEKKKIT